ncbi:MAG: aminotransferase class IV [Saprospiraceae bacterium]|nr:aminotransferase class IV [Saprospiraceae bacterium]
MYQFLETICIRDGHPLLLEWHQRRVDATLKHFYPEIANDDVSFQLTDILSSCTIPPVGMYRCRIVFDINSISVEFFPYESRLVKSLCLIEAPASYDYSYKYADRKVLDDLFAQRGDADDILITRNGWITDTSIANIAFRKEDRWYTPSIPLLAGTTWKRLVASGVLIPRPIHQSDVHHYDAYKIFNAMNDWDIAETPLTRNSELETVNSK